MAMNLIEISGRDDALAQRLRANRSGESPRPQELSTPNSPKTGEAVNLADSFGDVFREKVNVLSGLLSESAEMDRRLASGEVENIHEVMIAAAKSGFALNVGVQLRNLILRGYNQLTQLR